jgi:hypothetical protein
MTPKRRISLPRLLPIAVSAAALVWLLRAFPLRVVASYVTVQVVEIMAPALVAFSVVTLWIEAMSIRRMLAQPPPDFGLWSAARIKCASYLPALIHYVIGQGALALLLHRRTAIPLAETLGLVALISSIDALLALAAASGSAAVLGVQAPGLRLGLVGLVIAGFLASLALLRSAAPLGPLERVRTLAIFEALRRVPLGRLAELFALRILFSTCFVAGCASAFVAFRIAAPPAHLIAGIMIVALVAALPIAVAGLGTSQAAFIYLFSEFAPAERVLAMSLVLSFGILSLRTAMGLCFARELTREALSDARVIEA